MGCSKVFTSLTYHLYSIIVQLQGRGCNSENKNTLRATHHEIHASDIGWGSFAPHTTPRQPQHPSLLIPFVDGFTCFTGNGMTEAMLEPHLKDEAGATQQQVAWTFFILGGMYLITMPTIGYVSAALAVIVPRIFCMF